MFTFVFQFSTFIPLFPTLKIGEVMLENLNYPLLFPLIFNGGSLDPGVQFSARPSGSQAPWD